MTKPEAVKRLKTLIKQYENDSYNKQYREGLIEALKTVQQIGVTNKEEEEE